ncbi:MAG: hypothetical protein ABSG70_02160 [Terriglobales bacterium]
MPRTSLASTTTTDPTRASSMKLDGSGGGGLGSNRDRFAVT